MIDNRVYENLRMGPEPPVLKGQEFCLVEDGVKYYPVFSFDRVSHPLNTDLYRITRRLSFWLHPEFYRSTSFEYYPTFNYDGGLFGPYNSGMTKNQELFTKEIVFPTLANLTNYHAPDGTFFKSDIGIRLLLPKDWLFHKVVAPTTSKFRHEATLLVVSNFQKSVWISEETYFTQVLDII